MVGLKAKPKENKPFRGFPEQRHPHGTPKQGTFERRFLQTFSRGLITSLCDCKALNGLTASPLGREHIANIYVSLKLPQVAEAEEHVAFFVHWGPDFCRQLMYFSGAMVLRSGKKEFPETSCCFARASMLTSHSNSKLHTCTCQLVSGAAQVVPHKVARDIEQLEYLVGRGRIGARESDTLAGLFAHFSKAQSEDQAFSPLFYQNQASPNPLHHSSDRIPVAPPPSPTLHPTNLQTNPKPP